MDIIFVTLFFVGFYLGFVFPLCYNKFISERKYIKEFKSLMPLPLDEDRLCKATHTWMEVISTTETGDRGTARLCSTCGFIPSLNKMATSTTLSRAKENNRLRLLDQKLALEFENLEQEGLRSLLEEIKKDTTYERVHEVYNFGKTSSKRFVIYEIIKAQESGEYK